MHAIFPMQKCASFPALPVCCRLGLPLHANNCLSKKSLTTTHAGTIILMVIFVLSYRFFLRYGEAVREEQRQEERRRDQMVCLKCGSPAVAPKEQVQGAEEGKDKEEQPLLIQGAHHC